MPPHDLGQRLFQDRDVQRARQTYRAGDVISRAFGSHLVRQPHSLLREREHQFIIIAQTGFDGRHVHSVSRPDVRLHNLGQTGDRRRFKETPHRNLDFKEFLNSGYDLRREQAVPAQLEEVVVNAHAANAQHFAPHSGQHLFHWRLRFLSQLYSSTLFLLHLLRQPHTIYLPLPRQRYLFLSPSFTSPGILFSGSLPPNALLTSPAPFPLPLTTYATNRLSPPRSCATTTASLTPHSSLIACSTSPHSTLIPLIFTCSSTRPTYSNSPPARYLTRSPVRYILSPDSRLKGSGTNRSAVIPASFR